MNDEAERGTQGKYALVLRAFYGQAWAMEVNALEGLRMLLEARASGVDLTQEEAEAWAAAQPYGSRSRSAATQQAGTDVAIIPLYGPMLARADTFSRASGMADTRSFAAAVTAAANDPSIAEIVLDIDSPGGQVTSVDAAARAVREAQAIKPVTAVSQGAMASAAYWVAAQAGRVVASPNANVGSISVLFTHEDRSAALGRQGVKVTTLTSGDKKAIGASSAPLDAAGKTEIMRLVNDYHAAFVDAVAAGRGKSPEYVQTNWADGRVETGRIAQRIGMIDAVGTLDSVLADISNGTAASATAAAGRSSMEKTTRHAAAATDLPSANDADSQAEARADPGSLNLVAAIGILRDAPRIGADVDEPEGARNISISDTLALNMADVIESTSDALSAQLEAAEAEASALTEKVAALEAALEEERETARVASSRSLEASREDIARRAIEAAALPPVSVENDAAFLAKAQAAAVAAESDAAAGEAVAALIEDRMAVLTARPTDNHPGIRPQDPEAVRESDRNAAVARVRAGIPDLNN